MSLDIPKFLSKKRAPKFPDSDIRAIRRMKRDGKTGKQIALEFPHISSQYIYDVLAGRSRKGVQ
jgi:hypothetical protein